MCNNNIHSHYETWADVRKKIFTDGARLRTKKSESDQGWASKRSLCSRRHRDLSTGDKSPDKVSKRGTVFSSLLYLFKEDSHLRPFGLSALYAPQSDRGSVLWSLSHLTVDKCAASVALTLPRLRDNISHSAVFKTLFLSNLRQMQSPTGISVTESENVHFVQENCCN